MVLACVAALGARAAETEKAEIYFSAGSYQYTFVSVIAAEHAAVHAVVTDYDDIHRVNDSITESRVLERHGPDRLKRLLALRQCVLVFCFDIRFVEEISIDDERIETTIVPAESTFREGTAVWRLEALDGGRTRITVTAMQTPDFWIPPVLGPMLLKRVFLREIAETCANIERLALAAPEEASDAGG